MACTLAVQSAFLVSVAPATTWRIERDGTGDFTTIQPAVDVAAPGDTIMLGIGRYPEVAPFHPAKTWPSDVCVGIAVDSLTIIGVDRDAVIIGPEHPNYTMGDGPRGIVGRESVVTSLNLKDLTVENVFDGGYLYGLVRVDNCVFRSCEHGLSYWSPNGMIIKDSYFSDNKYGVVTYSGSANTEVFASQFAYNNIGITFAGSINCIVQDCEVVDCGVGVDYQQGSAGTIMNCHIIADNIGISIALSSNVLLLDNRIWGDTYSLIAPGFSVVTGYRNIFQGGAVATLAFHAIGVALHECHIIKHTGMAVEVIGPVWPPPVVLDLRNNYWGTTSADSIAAWIHDRNDDPFILGTVDYEPFSGQPMGSSRRSWGAVKNLYR